MRSIRPPWLVALGLVLVVSQLPAAPPAIKRLIEFGWDEPDTTFLREQLSQMEQTPFDGCVFHVNYRKSDQRHGSLTWEAWSTNAFSDSDVQAALEDLKAIRGNHRFHHHFLRFNTTPARIDWFEDHAAVLQNARLAARMAREGGCPGLLFDIEQYDGPLFDYRQQRDAKTKSWELYADQVRRRGREVMHAFQEAYPDLIIFLTFGYSLPWAQTQEGRVALADCHYGLLAPFMDGLVDAAQGRTRLVDGHELSYGYRDAGLFSKAYQTMQTTLLPIVRDPEKYHRVTSLGFGLWLDFDWRKRGWNTEDPAKNYFTPQGFADSLRAALAATDDYVWIYTETPRWWSNEGGPQKLPTAYSTAIRKAVEEVGTSQIPVER